MITPKINEKYCKNCGYCVHFCPTGALKIGEERNKKGYFYPVFDPECGCTGCGSCAVICPDVAIELVDDGTEA